MIIKLASNTQKIINSYMSLRIGRHKVVCPYYQNIANKRDKPVLVGKGLPKEIENETKRLFNSLNKNSDTIDPQTIRLHMTMANIGVDCSGFTARIIESLLEENGLGSLRKNFKPPNNKPLSTLRHYFKTETNLSADTLSNKTNCTKIVNFNDILPGDFIRAGRVHIAIVTEVEKDNKEIKRIKYAHSTSDYADKHGARLGEIIINNPNGQLEKQEWTENYKERNWMLEDYLRAKPTDRGIRRLKSLQ